MASLQTVLASLGNAGAVSNARTSLDQRDHEAWLVARLESRLAPAGGSTRLAAANRAGVAA